MGHVGYLYACARVKCVRTSHQCGMSVYVCARVGARVCVHICVVCVCPRNSSDELNAPGGGDELRGLPLFFMSYFLLLCYLTFFTFYYENLQTYSAVERIVQ